MSVHLVGGGWGEHPAVWRAFLAEAAARASGTPRVAVIAVRDDARDHVERLVADLRAVDEVEPVVVALPEGGALDPAVLTDGLDGLLVGGGTTPAYLDVLAPHAAAVRALVAAGMPYAGFSAGSAIASERALVGGWLLDGSPVVDEEVAEGLAAVTVRDGLGLVPFPIDVHAAQWGTLARLIAAVDDGLVPRGVAIDEDTALLLHGGDRTVVGRGNVWWVSAVDGGAAVRRETATR